MNMLKLGYQRLIDHGTGYQRVVSKDHNPKVISQGTGYQRIVSS